jgi:predicted negative regulator of RcsB-dependent stress response
LAEKHPIEERCVDEYLTEAEQWERAKAWLRTYGAWILGGVVIALAGIAAWNWWQERQLAVAVEASASTSR